MVWDNRNVGLFDGYTDFRNTVLRVVGVVGVFRMKLSLYWQDWPRTVYPIVYPMSRTFQKILMKKRSFLEFGGLWSCRRVVIPKFSRVIICFFGIYHLLKNVGGGNLSKKHRWKGQYFWNWHVGNGLKGDAFPKNSVYSMGILELMEPLKYLWRLWRRTTLAHGSLLRSLRSLRELLK